jgi:hypothetical protein
MNSLAPISGLDSPSRASRATCASCAVSVWAEELGLTGSDAIARVGQPLRDINRQQEPASRQPDREAAD